MTKTYSTPSDYLVRTEAIDPHHSFIIQAPAGSGKTELLIQRYLNILAYCVQNPEEILCITFTRKAAAEMRERILQALLSAKNNNPVQEHQKTTRNLAELALKQDSLHQWCLLENPNRFRILTFDAFANSLCARMPFLTRLGSNAQITESPEDLYREAIQKIFSNLENERWKKSVGILLDHLENRMNTLENLLLQLLGKRDQWLPHIIPNHQDPEKLKPILEAGLRRVSKDALLKTQAQFPKQYQTETLELLNFAATQSPDVYSKKIFLSFDSKDNEMWLGIAQLLLKKEGKLRKTVDKRSGFPNHFPDQKKRMLALLSDLSQEKNIEELEQALQHILDLPPQQYHQQQWKVLSALISLLPLLVAQLQLVFYQHQTTDFIELNLRALDALGNFEEPSDLALQLDYQIKHILVDEFQDTSLLQFSLLQRLIKNWDSELDRTLFLVGDPMQSIYRFRNAEVGLFLRTQQQGISPLILKPLYLQCNFRSQKNLIAWFNYTFQNVFPKNPDVASGAVPYTPSIAAVETARQTAVSYYAATNETLVAQEMCRSIQSLQKQFPADRIAILVRTRTQLPALLAALQHSKINYQAVDLHHLEEEPEIQDLLALTRALTQLNDRIAWLAILRAPWCGLSISDLYYIANFEDPMIPILQTLLKFAGNPEVFEQISELGQKNLQRVIPILQQALREQRHRSFSFWIKSTWITLGGKLCLQHEKQIENAESYFNLLCSFEKNMDAFSITLLSDQLKKLFSNTSSDAKDSVQIMTIHKAKGLEFDHVLLPFLETSTRPNRDELLLWMERTRQDIGSDLILAPIKSAAEEKDRIYQYVQGLESEKLEQERIRLLYVAATRARESLHLFSKIILNEENIPKNPMKNSFLSLLGTEAFLTNLECEAAQPSENQSTLPQTYYRLKTEVTLPFTIYPKEEATLEQKYTWPLLSTHLQRALGTVFHKTLESLEKVKLLQDEQWKQQLQQQQVPETVIPELMLELRRMTQTMLSDPKGSWILAPHDDAKNEFALSGLIQNKIVSVIIDRTFVDNGIRWIIDYKTSAPQENETLDAFLELEKILYYDVMQQYATLMRGYDPQLPVHLALYFPRICAWISWIPNL